MPQYYELVKEAKPQNKAKKLKFDPSQKIYFASCKNYMGIEILGEASGLLLTLADGKTSIAEIVARLSEKLCVAVSDIEEVVIIEVRNLQRKHLLHLEV